MAKNTVSGDPVKIMPCKCKNSYQDKMYGDGQRVNNRAGAKKEVSYRCTVCGDVKKVVAAQPPAVPNTEKSK